MFWIFTEAKDKTVRFAVYAQPRASRTEVVGLHGEALRVRLAAPPVEGEANAELLSFLAKKLGVSKSALRIVKGERGRHKLVEVRGLDPKQIAKRLDPSA